MSVFDKYKHYINTVVYLVVSAENIGNLSVNYATISNKQVINTHQ